jgi:hypothetical protein
MISSSDVLTVPGMKNPSLLARGDVALGARRRAGALHEYYENSVGRHREDPNTDVRVVFKIGPIDAILQC